MAEGCNSTDRFARLASQGVGRQETFLPKRFFSVTSAAMKIEESEELREQLKFLREEERHEILWIGNRLQWMLLCQAFLMTAAIMSLSKDYPWWTGLAVSLVLGTLGSWLALRGGLAIRAACDVIEAWLKREKNLCDMHPDLLKYRLNRPAHVDDNLLNDASHCIAAGLHLRMHRAFAIAWCALFVISLAVASNRQKEAEPPVIYISWSTTSPWRIELGWSRPSIAPNHIIMGTALLGVLSATLLIGRYLFLRKKLKEGGKQLHSWPKSQTILYPDWRREGSANGPPLDG